jgi:hypothetical protein
MQRHFKTYDECYTVAQKYSNQYGVDIGIEKASPYDPGFLWFHLPKPENRYGHELQCEVVTPMRRAESSSSPLILRGKIARLGGSHE